MTCITYINCSIKWFHRAIQFAVRIRHFSGPLIWKWAYTSTNDTLFKWNRGLDLFADKNFESNLSFLKFFLCIFLFPFFFYFVSFFWIRVLLRFFLFSYICFSCSSFIQGFPHICVLFIFCFWFKIFPRISFFYNVFWISMIYIIYII